ncbi:DNA polymerase I [Balneolaceae bacterium ANBcel3]|nr:DNA polymerase I [Balneolaceae bacterium ANBcel3]
MSQRLFLIDGSAMAYRSYFAMMKANLKNSEGVPTGALLGFANTFFKIIEREKPEYMGVIWDTHAPTFRHEMDENYKANRPPQPEDLTQAVPLIKKLVTLFGYDNLEKEGYEADDIIGTLAKQAAGQDITVYMVTPDKDFMQLIGDNVYMLKPQNRGDGFEVIDDQGVMNFFEVSPDKVIDVLALIGDTSDNIPGVPGIGKKGASKIINEFGSLEKALDNAESISGKRAREGLLHNREQALKSRELITIQTNVPDTPEWKLLERRVPEKEQLYSFLKQMEFNTLLIKLRNFYGEIAPSSSKNNQQGSLFDTVSSADSVEVESDLASYDKEKVTYRLCSTKEDLKSLIKDVNQAEFWSFDTETTSTDPLTAELLGISFSHKKGYAWYLDVLSFSKETLIKELQPLFYSEKALKIAHNLKYDYQLLHRFGIKVEGPLFDTMIAAHLINHDQKLGMDALSKSWLSYEPVSITTLIGEKGKNQRSMKEVPVEEVMVYACEDADITLQLFECFQKELVDKNQKTLAETIEFPLVPVLARTELQGIKLHLDLLKSFSKELTDDIIILQKEIFEIAGQEFNINSTKQLGKVLFEDMKIPAGKKTATGKYGTSEAVLDRLAPNYEIAAKILEFRKLAKLRSTYVDALPKLVNKETGRIHTTFNQHVTSTGRLSSTNPNLQNIPIRTERGRGIRKAFVSEEGSRLIAADYSQIELRIIASISEDQAMIDSFVRGEDIHARTACEIFGLSSLEEVNSDQRRKAKEVNFGIPYGISAFGLAQRLGIPNKEAQKMIDDYFLNFPAIKKYIEKTIAGAHEKGFVETLSGRRRYISDIHSSNWNVRSFAERTAVNMPIQGTAADLIKIAMIQVDQHIKEKGLETRILLQVHDELVLEAPENEIEEASNLVKTVMEQAMPLKVPLSVELAFSDNWLDAH